MMAHSWTAILSRLTRHAPVAVDDLIRSDPQRGMTLFPLDVPITSERAFPQADALTSHIGIRVTQPPADPATTAMRLISAASEKSVVPIILTPLDSCGLERFGLRVERLPSDPAQAARAEAQLVKFWNLALVIDGRDVEALA
ncbi:hypothetical protein ACP2AV_09695 [Aliiroseovarius sp. PTFE2010]|uniref:hypothetical protein n=1 Tax=Aliiroseovarius sp. PTFE2010 TaxID=3417190 RepID=UPI003CF01BF6